MDLTKNRGDPRCSQMTSTMLRIGYRYLQTYTNIKNKPPPVIQATDGRDEPNIVLCGHRSGHHNLEFRT